MRRPLVRAGRHLGGELAVEVLVDGDAGLLDGLLRRSRTWGPPGRPSRRPRRRGRSGRRARPMYATWPSAPPCSLANAPICLASLAALRSALRAVRPACVSAMARMLPMGRSDGDGGAVALPRGLWGAGTARPAAPTRAATRRLPQEGIHRHRHEQQRHVGDRPVEQPHLLELPARHLGLAPAPAARAPPTATSRPPPAPPRCRTSRCSRAGSAAARPRPSPSCRGRSAGPPTLLEATTGSIGTPTRA